MLNGRLTLSETTLHVSIHQLGKAYGLRWALRGVDLELAPGEMIALLGPNGAGKSTLLKLLAGLVQPSTGRIEFDGTRDPHADAVSRSSIGFLAPGEHLYDHLTIRENLDFFTALYSKDNNAAVINDALDKVGLKQHSREFVGALSTGMKCRLSIAKWQLLEPRLLLLDEPYGVLDPSGAHLLEQFLQRQCAKGHVVVIASHHIARVLQLCSRAVILHQGRLTFDEPRQQPWDSLIRAFGEFLPHAQP